MTLMQEMTQRALKQGIPLSAHFDVTYRCNERCVHCYLDHDDHGEMSTDAMKTNGAMIREPQARRLRELGVENIQISVYSHRPEVHDAITKLPGSLKRTINAIRFLKAQGLRVTIANVLMKWNVHDHTGVHALAEELGAIYTLDPTITPKIDGDTSILDLRIPGEELAQVFRIEKLVGNVEEFCAPPP